MSIRRLLMAQAKKKPFIEANFPSSWEGRYVEWNSMLSIDKDTFIGNGVKIEYNVGQFNVSGTPTATVVRQFSDGLTRTDLTDGHNYLFFGCWKTGSSSTFRCDVPKYENTTTASWLTEFGNGVIYNAKTNTKIGASRFVAYIASGKLNGSINLNMIDLTSLGIDTIAQFVEYMGYNSLQDMPIFDKEIGVKCVIHNGNLYEI